MRHRTDIDGLRAVAVGLVILYHCGFDRFFPGGFIGVDIFFVISGFLLTGIIAEELEEGKFSLISFYSRRSRRILPAVIVMYFCAGAVSYFVFMPDDTAEIVNSILYSAGFVSNLFFYSKAGYFQGSLDNNPMLHTWSLSVEEQFYVLLPLGLLALSKAGRPLLPVIGGMLIASLAWSAYTVRIDSGAAFYLVQSRAWELLLGSFLAVSKPFKAPSKASGNVVAVFGAVMIVGSATLLTKNSSFPGLAAVPVCLGTALVIITGTGDSVIKRLLSLRPLTSIGLISYSLYLWHWPIWVFFNEYGSWAEGWQLVPVTLSLAVAWISWKFVEQPLRHAHATPAVSVSVGGAAVVCSIAGALVAGAAVDAVIRSHPLASKVARTADYHFKKEFREGRCFLTSGNSSASFKQEECLSLAPKQTNVALIGDSHAAHLYPGLARREGIHVLQANASGCRPVLDGDGSERCTELMNYMLRDFITGHDIDVIVLAARWQTEDMAPLQRTIGFLRGRARQIVVVGPVVEYDDALPHLLAKSLYRREPFNGDAHIDRKRWDMEELVETTVRSSGARYISLQKVMCHPRCDPWASEGVPLQFDYGHFTADGSVKVVAGFWSDLRH